VYKIAEKMTTGLLLSGGIESTAIAYWKRPQVAYTIDYGHSAAAAEICASQKVCHEVNCEHVVITVNLSSLGTGLLAHRNPSKLSPHEEWWPFRNQMLLTIAGMRAVQDGINCLLIGTTISDSRHADGRSSFIKGINKLMSQQEGRLAVIAPALQLSSIQLLKKAKVPSGMILHTFSCHRGNVHCCRCPGCNKRLEILDSIGL
jgi:7-cyano-7-deazaguanine synthase